MRVEHQVSRDKTELQDVQELPAHKVNAEKLDLVDSQELVVSQDVKDHEV